SAWSLVGLRRASKGSLETPHTTYVPLRLRRTGRIPRRGCAYWLPTAVGLRPTFAGFRRLSGSRPPATPGSFDQPAQVGRRGLGTRPADSGGGAGSTTGRRKGGAPTDGQGGGSLRLSSSLSMREAFPYARPSCRARWGHHTPTHAGVTAG